MTQLFWQSNRRGVIKLNVISQVIGIIVVACSCSCSVTTSKAESHPKLSTSIQERFATPLRMGVTRVRAPGLSDSVSVVVTFAGAPNANATELLREVRRLCREEFGDAPKIQLLLQIASGPSD